jgi:hypothetical protein
MIFSLSATAPQFLPEHEKQERSLLSEEERQQVSDDIHGNVYYEETEFMRCNGTRLLKEALDMIDVLQKSAYLEACQLVPELVQRESNPVGFLRCEQYNAWTAATRLCEYWKQRKALFQHNAYKPMTMAPGGALTEQDLETLQSGYMNILPPTSEGRAVIFFDGAPSKVLPRDSVLRVWFYLIQIMTSAEKVQRDGYLLINSIKVCIALVMSHFPLLHSLDSHTHVSY